MNEILVTPLPYVFLNVRSKIESTIAASAAVKNIAGKNSIYEMNVFSNELTKLQALNVEKISDKSMQYRCIDNLIELSEKKILGGTSIKDRDSRNPKIRTLKPKTDDIKKFLDFKPENLESLISHCFRHLSICSSCSSY